MRYEHICYRKFGKCDNRQKNVNHLSVRNNPPPFFFKAKLGPDYSNSFLKIFIVHIFKHKLLQAE